MPPAWFGPHSAHGHPMRQQQAPQQGGARFHPPGQRMPPNGGAGMNGGVHSPHTFHQRSSPPMRGPYPGQHGHGGGPRPHHPPPPPPPPPPHGVVGHPHGPRMSQGGSRFQVQHPQTMGVVGPRPMPPNAAAGHNHMARHHAPSPGMPRRMQLPPPNVMRPIPQQPGGGSGRAAFEQHRVAVMQQQGPPRVMQQQHQQQHMMRLQHEHQQQQQMQQQRQSFHHHSSAGSDNHMHSQGNADSENRMHAPPPPPETPEQQRHMHGAHSRSPSPPPIPPSEFQQHQHHNAADDSQKPSPASKVHPETEASMGEYQRHQQQHFLNKGPPPAASWNAMPGPGMGPLRESRLQNMPQKRMMMPMHHHPQHPIPCQGSSMNPYINENMQRFQAMEQHKQHMGHHMKVMHHHQQQHLMQAKPNAMSSPDQQQQGEQSPENNKKQAGKKGNGPDITMDAASMLLALRTSASPATVSAATLEEQTSKDQSENTKKMTKTDQQDRHDEMEDDDVPALASSSSSLSAPPKPPCPPVQHHEVPKNFPTRLALPNDEAKLNSLHCFLRSELLEIFVVERSANKSPTHSPGSSVGRVGLRCVFCAMERKRNAVSTTVEHDTASSSHLHRSDEAPMAVFYPKSIAEIYRLVTSWQRCHLRKCRNLPPDIRSKWTCLRETDKSRGKTHYWITSAKEIGLVDCQCRAGGIRFASPRSSSAASGSIANTASLAADNDSMNEGMYSQSHEEDSSVHSNSQSYKTDYQPFSNPNFMEGPSQKHREASARDISTTAVSVVESPMKDDSVAPEESAVSAVSSSNQVAVVGV